MPIQLRHQTQQSVSPSALSHGVGLPVSDGGAGAASRALGQVAGAASQIGATLKRKEDALANQAVTDASSRYQTEVRDWSNKLRISAKANDGDGVLAAQKELDSLKDAPLNAFLDATDNSLNISDDKWKSAQLGVGEFYAKTRGAADLATVNSQYTARFTRGLDAVRDRSALDIQEGAVGAKSFAAVDADANALASGDLASGATQPAMEGLHRDLANTALNHIKAFGVVKESYTSVTAYNKDVDTYLGVIQKSGAYGEFKGQLLNAVKGLRVSPPKGKKVSLPDAANKSRVAHREHIGSKVNITPDAIQSQKAILEGNKDAPLTDVARGELKSLDSFIQHTEWFGSEDTRLNLIEWSKDNIDKTGREFIQEQVSKDTLETMSKEDRSALYKHADHVLNSFTSVGSETGKQDTSINTSYALAATSPENMVQLKSAEKSLTLALETFDLDDPAISQGHIAEAVKNFGFVTEDDIRNREFVGLNKLIEYVEKNPTSGRALVQAVNVAEMLWSPRRSSNFTANSSTDTGSSARDLLVAGLRHNTMYKDDVDVKGMTHVIQGAKAAEWFNKNKETPQGSKYENWTTYRDSEDSKISELYQQFESVPTADAKFWNSFINGFAISKIEENPNLTSKDIDELVANTVNDRVTFFEAYGNPSMSLRAKRQDGSYSSQFMSEVRRAPANVASLAARVLPFVTREDVRPYTDVISEFGGTSLTKQEYAEGRVDKAIEVFIRSGNLKFNRESFIEYGIDDEVAKLSNPEDQLRRMVQEGAVRLSNTLNKDGVGAYVLEVDTPILGSEGEPTDKQWVSLVGEDNMAMPLAEDLLDINYQEWRELQEEKSRHKWSKRLRAISTRSGGVVPASVVKRVDDQELF